MCFSASSLDLVVALKRCLAYYTEEEAEPTAPEVFGLRKPLARINRAVSLFPSPSRFPWVPVHGAVCLLRTTGKAACAVGKRDAEGASSG